MSHLLLTHQQNPDFIGSADRTFKRGFTLNVNPAMAIGLVVGLIMLIGLISLTHLNSMSTKGYDMQRLEDEYHAFITDSEINDMLILNARSMTTLETHPHVQSMVAPESVYYLESVTGLAQQSNGS